MRGIGRLKYCGVKLAPLHGANAAKKPRRRDATEKASAILGYWEAKSAPA